MRILLTGDRGFVGSHIRAGLESVYHVRAGVESIYDVVGLDVRGGFQEWIEDMNATMDTDIDAVIHAGAVSNNQSQDPNIYLWNSYATYLLAQRASEKMDGRLPIPFILFSTFLVGSTVDARSMRTPYTWSKVQAEGFVRNSSAPCDYSAAVCDVGKRGGEGLDEWIGAVSVGDARFGVYVQGLGTEICPCQRCGGGGEALFV